MPKFKVDDMTCAHCVSAVTAAVRNADPAAEVEVDLASGRVTIESAANPAALAAAIEAAGYPARAAPERSRP